MLRRTSNSRSIVMNIIAHTWKALETLTKDRKLRSCINGITISPKKNFCIIKIWLANCNNQNPDIIDSKVDLNSYGCLFKKHLPTY